MFGIFLLAFHCIVYPALATSNEHIDTIGKQLSVQADMIKQLGAIVEFQNERLAKLERQDAVIRDQDLIRHYRLLQHSTEPSTPVVAFYAYLSKSEVDPGHHHTIIFDAVKTNSGNGYSEHSGVFTAPMAGYYVFSFTVVGYAGSRMPVQLVCNSKVVGASAADSKSDTPYPSASSTIVLNLNQNDLCFLRTTTTTNSIVGNIYSSDWSRSSFTGWKL